LWLLVLLSACILFGASCNSTGFNQGKAAHASNRNTQRISLGWVRYYAPNTGTAVVECTFLPENLPEQLLSKDEQLKTTARLRTTGIMAGHMLGVVVIHGQPSPGDEVVYYISP